MTTIKTDPPLLSFANHGTTPYTSRHNNILHRDHSTWVWEASGEVGRVQASLLPPFWSSNGCVGVVVGVRVRCRCWGQWWSWAMGKLQLQRPLSLQHLKRDNQLLTKRGGVFGIGGVVLRPHPQPRTPQTLIWNVPMTAIGDKLPYIGNYINRWVIISVNSEYNFMTRIYYLSIRYLLP